MRITKRREPPILKTCFDLLVEKRNVHRNLYTFTISSNIAKDDSAWRGYYEVVRNFPRGYTCFIKETKEGTDKRHIHGVVASRAYPFYKLLKKSNKNRHKEYKVHIESRKLDDDDALTVWLEYILKDDPEKLYKIEIENSNNHEFKPHVDTCIKQIYVNAKLNESKTKIITI